MPLRPGHTASIGNAGSGCLPRSCLSWRSLSRRTLFYAVFGASLKSNSGVNGRRRRGQRDAAGSLCVTKAQGNVWLFSSSFQQGRKSLRRHKGEERMFPIQRVPSSSGVKNLLLKLQRLLHPSGSGTNRIYRTHTHGNPGCPDSFESFF